MKNQSLIRYQLRSGKTILISLDDYLDMTDELHQKFEASGGGYDILDPFDNFSNNSQNSDIQDIEIEIEELTEEEIRRIQEEFDEDS